MDMPGLSILIPIYNYDVRHLVQALHQQVSRADWPIEILCWDDASKVSFQRLNAPLGDLPGVQYNLMPQNLGRSRIRNRLAEAAQYNYLLFMDGDSEVTHGDFIKRYLRQCRQEELLYGGRIYEAEPPQDRQLRFHWHYGRMREVQTVVQRQQQPYHSFMTNNFLIPKPVFDPIQFDERLLQYGHEDTLFGLELMREGVRIRHIDNPLLHAGLEPAGVFLRKSVQAVENLAFLYREGSLKETRLIRAYEYLIKWHILRPVRWSLSLLLPFLKGYLLRSAQPSLRVFDIYKLGVFIRCLH